MKFFDFVNSIIWTVLYNKNDINYSKSELNYGISIIYTYNHRCISIILPKDTTIYYCKRNDGNHTILIGDITIEPNHSYISINENDNPLFSKLI